jgi:hypothetical protein
MTEYASDLSDFGDLLRAAANWKNQRTAIVEKDYYLTRALHTLRTQHQGEFILKGGISLSKGWNLLDRFSEDLDILVRSELGWGAGRRDGRLKLMRDNIAKTKGLPLHEGDRRTRSETGVSRTAVYRYESITTDVPGLGRNILFEAGYRGRPDAAVFPINSINCFRICRAEGVLEFGGQAFEIELQDVRRTFVEKGLAIHGTYCANFCENRMRHYYDLSKLCGLEEVKSFVGTGAYAQCVADAKKLSEDSFPNQALPEGNSLSNSPAFNVSGKLCPGSKQITKKKRNIFFSEPPSLTSILSEIEKLLPKM